MSIPPTLKGGGWGRGAQLYLTSLPHGRDNATQMFQGPPPSPNCWGCASTGTSNLRHAFRNLHSSSNLSARLRSLHETRHARNRLSFKLGWSATLEQTNAHTHTHTHTHTLHATPRHATPRHATPHPHPHPHAHPQTHT